MTQQPPSGPQPHPLGHCQLPAGRSLHTWPGQNLRECALYLPCFHSLSRERGLGGGGGGRAVGNPSTVRGTAQQIQTQVSVAPHLAWEALSGLHVTLLHPWHPAAYLALTIFPALSSTISSNPTAKMSAGLLSSGGKWQIKESGPLTLCWLGHWVLRGPMGPGVPLSRGPHPDHRAHLPWAPTVHWAFPCLHPGARDCISQWSQSINQKSHVEVPLLGASHHPPGQTPCDRGRHCLRLV